MNFIDFRKHLKCETLPVHELDIYSTEPDRMIEVDGLRVDCFVQCEDDPSKFGIQYPEARAIDFDAVIFSETDERDFALFELRRIV